jgi:hypothetical protein
MTITIQISDNGAVTTTASSQGQSSESNPGVGGGTDGGAPRASLGGNQETSGSGGGDTTDIGAPPQWLSAARAQQKAIHPERPATAMIQAPGCRRAGGHQSSDPPIRLKKITGLGNFSAAYPAEIFPDHFLGTMTFCMGNRSLMGQRYPFDLPIRSGVARSYHLTPIQG